jgi:putative component of membrane protein insertase Oxa1/YidC/SpoIIIJ protein YidD
MILLWGLLAGFVHAGPAPDPAPADPAQMPALAAPIRLFQKYLSGADGHRCPMTPSCSSYAQQAMQRHGVLKGWVMSCDRLMRCGRDELRQRPPVSTPNGPRTPDSVGNNDFWWHDSP